MCISARPNLKILHLGIAAGAMFRCWNTPEFGILAPFQYVEIIGATGLGLLIFGDFPDAVTWLGIGIIVGSGMYVFHRESRLASEANL